MSKKLALSSALSVALMAIFAVFGQQAVASQADASETAARAEISAPAFGG